MLNHHLIYFMSFPFKFKLSHFEIMLWWLTAVSTWRRNASEIGLVKFWVCPDDGFSDMGQQILGVGGTTKQAYIPDGIKQERRWKPL